MLCAHSASLDIASHQAALLFGYKTQRSVSSPNQAGLWDRLCYLHHLVWHLEVSVMIEAELVESTPHLVFFQRGQHLLQ
jgi:hypothetical protein